MRNNNILLLIFAKWYFEQKYALFKFERSYEISCYLSTVNVIIPLLLFVKLKLELNNTMEYLACMLGNKRSSFTWNTKFEVLK